MNNFTILAAKNPSVSNVVLVGMAVVFAALIALVCILCIIPLLIKSKKEKKTNEPATITDAVKDDENTQNDEELVAVITAAIMASYTAQPNCKLKVTSFRKISDSAPIWNRTARMEYTS